MTALLEHPARPARPPLRHRVTGGLRAGLWRSAFGLLGGLRVEGRLPAGGCVVVANHGSHADTPALLAALGGGGAPRVAAAADYWFAGGLRPRVCRALVGGFAVRRGGGGAADLAAAADLLRAGRVVVVFPEGTRSRDGELGAFRTGALRLAADAGVPVVPAGISGTAALLPPGGGRGALTSPVTVRLGAPVASAGDLRVRAEQAREAVAALAAGPALAPASQLRARAALLAASPTGTALVAAWALAEALAWPLLPELAVGLLVLAAPRSWLRLALAAAAGSVAGGLLAYALAAGGVRVPAPLTTPRMAAAVAAQTAREGAVALRSQPLSGVPYKVWAARAGADRVGAVPFALESLRARGGRLLAVSGVVALLAAALRPVLARRYALVVAVVVPGFLLSLSRVVSSWS